MEQIFSKLFFSKTGNFWIGLLEFSEKFLNKGQKVNQVAFIWPFWPWKLFRFKYFLEKVPHFKFHPNWTTGSKNMDKRWKRTSIVTFNTVCNDDINVNCCQYIKNFTDSANSTFAIHGHKSVKGIWHFVPTYKVVVHGEKMNFIWCLEIRVVKQNDFKDFVII